MYKSTHCLGQKKPAGQVPRLRKPLKARVTNFLKGFCNETKKLRE